ncbi:FecR domain-containing protein [Sphingomonas sp. JC676]|uniref:FecR family protein n=1 Tax=Sphingomonas sp. JC676 TaxID=2768065 RepID=UPI00165777F8|nr:FecR domain-containing protein [Sphingomonas sp. JC676]MBC9032985.1 FecR domain-containing protein [Sphingomonas sp. JC676]
MRNRGAPEPVAEAARLWAIRVQDPAFDGWDGFTAWLEADAAHLAAYEQALDDDAQMTGLLSTAEQFRAEAPARSRRRLLVGAGSAIAATVVAAAGWWTFGAGPAEREIATRRGEHRTLALADGSKVQMNGATRVRYQSDAPRRVALIEGEALFEVRHDARDPFVVTVGATRLVDAGTVFNVVRQAQQTRVAVAEGAVIYSPGANEVRLEPGDALAVDGSAAPVLTRAAPQEIGSWRSGQLFYRDAPLDQVAADLARSLGEPVETVDAGDRRFTGTLAVRGEPRAVLARIAPLMGVRVSKSKEGWVLTPINGSPR